MDPITFRCGYAPSALGRSGSGQPLSRTIAPPVSTRRAGSPDRSSQAGPSSPSTIAAVAAVFASTHVAATTVAVRQRDATGPPVRGSIRWWMVVSPRCQRRTVVLDVAIAPSWIAIVSPSASVGVSLSSATRIRQPPSGATPAVAMSPPNETRTPPARPAAAWAAEAPRSAARALPVDPRSSSTPVSVAPRGGDGTARRSASRGSAPSGPPAARFVRGSGRSRRRSRSPASPARPSGRPRRRSARRHRGRPRSPRQRAG